MFRIIEKQVLSNGVKLMVVDAAAIARKAQPGQFIMLRVNETGERIPLTIADYDRAEGTVTIIFQEVGKTTRQLGLLSADESILDFVGPLGMPTHYDAGIRRVAVIGGGLGTAIAYPQAKQLHAMGVAVDVILGFRNKELVFFEDEMKKVADRVTTTTDDGSNGKKGFVTDVLREQIMAGAHYDLVIAIGPLIMMKVVSALTKEFGIKTVVSMNPVMIDGTGMCGGCRLTVGGKVKFACVDGPDFDGHLVDFDEAMRRQSFYRKEEAHACRLGEQNG
jgi:ferredoxin--NADP+ reductase